MQPVQTFSPLRLAAWFAAGAVMAAAVFAAYEISERRGHAALADRSVQQLDLYAAGLESELGKYENLPSILALDEHMLALLAAPADPRLRDKVNRRLANLNVRAGSVEILVLDANGTVLASSNWYEPQSSVGRDLSGMPYVADAIHSGQSRSFAASPARGAPESFFAQAIRRGGAVIGVSAVKISLEAIESAWVAAAAGSHSDELLVVDDNDVVIMSSQPDWKYRSTTALDDERRTRLAQAGSYPSREIAPLGLVVERSLEHGTQLVRVVQPDAATARQFVVQERVMARSGWRLVTLSDVAGVRQGARNAAFAAATLAALVGVGSLYLLQRRRAIAQRLAAREALQRANDELEQRVRDRTRELRDANDALTGEIAERRRTEAHLRSAQHELVQAGKLALLGQMSAGIAHEINQPLTALRALSDNTRRLLQIGRTADVDRNLQSIAGLTERMGRITAQLKSIARKSPPAAGSVLLAGAVNNVLELIRGRIDGEGVSVAVDVPPRLRVRGDAYRLEQVLTNLFGNALDAMKGSADKRLTVSATPIAGGVRLQVADTGPGIAPDVMPHLFEPFYSTKPAGEGLGLGLVVSSSIVREFGGVLRALNLPAGAAFEFDLKAEEETVDG
ncbi:sensor histidine kinase [Piscinibacter sp.]|uniref:sensor histidine kinase n=1 Tax=Piscinibacter sp. TaxID=1903157 RepID=UPI002BD402E2|nr:ATP-binding protein [Albitalea sp.]HUG23072.1 ATP-binding protein [Albitalea sp.]